jgi:WD40 repeat protein
MPLAISPAGNLVAYGVEDSVVLFDVDGEKVAHKLEGHLDTVRAVAFSPNGEFIASAAKDKTIRFWHVKQGKEVHVIENLPASTADLISPRFHMHSNSASELIFSADGSRIAIVGRAAQKAEIRSVGLK